MNDEEKNESLITLMEESKLYPPSQEVVRRANVKNPEEVRAKANEDPAAFWEEAAKELEWYETWDKVLDTSQAPFYKWFVGGKTNVVLNALDRHMKTDVADKTAIIWEGEPGDKRKVTYRELHEEVGKLANALKELGLTKGDRIMTYMPNVIEHAVALLACAKIGAVHSVVYAGFSSQALLDRIEDAEAKAIICADGLYRRGKNIPLKQTVDEAVERAPTIEHVIVLKRTGSDVSWNEDKNHWYHEIIENQSADCPTEKMDAEDPLFILYTSGSTGKPKGVLHVHGGYQVGIYKTLNWVFDIHDDDVFWCTADVGWITGHSYIVYGPLINGTTSIMYESVPDYPEPDRWWKLVEEYGVTLFYTAPTAIRAIMRYGEEWVEKHDLSSLRLLGSVGEPINPEAWRWYYDVVGKKKCPIMDTWWQTETGAFMITPLPVMPLKPGSGTKPFPGILADIVDGEGNPLPANAGGFLVIKNPWPSMLRTIYKNPDRYKDTYFSQVPGMYLTGDMARRDEDGYYWIQGRADDVVNIAGHRIGTAEVESALVSHEYVAEAAVIGVPDEVRGEILKAFVIPRQGIELPADIDKILKQHVRKEIGPIVVFKGIEISDNLPKTRSGKIMRRVLKARELGMDTGDTSTMAD